MSPIPLRALQADARALKAATVAETAAHKSLAITDKQLLHGQINYLALLNKRASQQQLKGILTFTESPNVSADFNHDPHSSIFHMDQTKVMEGTFVRVLSWYDNEWGFSNRMIDVAAAMGKLL